MTTKFRGYNVVKVYLSDEEAARVDLAIQYYKLTKKGPQNYNALFISAFNKLVEADPGLKAFIENSLAFVKRVQEQQQQQQQAGQKAGAKA